MSTGITQEALEAILSATEQMIARAVQPLQQGIEELRGELKGISEQQLASEATVDERVDALCDVVEGNEKRLSATIDESVALENRLDKRIDELLEQNGNTIKGLGSTIEAHVKKLTSEVSDIDEYLDQHIKERNAAEIGIHASIEKLNEDLAATRDKLRGETARDIGIAMDAADEVYSEGIEELQKTLKESHKEISHLVEDLDSQIRLQITDEVAKHDDHIQKQRSDDYARVMELLNEFRKMPGVHEIIEWQPHTTYDIGTTVRDGSALWSNLKSTSKPPRVDEGEWVCLSTGIDRMEVLDQHPNGVRATIGMYDTLGKEHRLSFDLPRVNRLDGSWVEDADYKHLDSVLSDGVRWIANCDSPKGKPGESKDWSIESMRGPAGKRGSRGPAGQKGDPGPVGELDTQSYLDVIKAAEADLDGVPVKRYRGEWKYQTQYRQGDLIRFGKQNLIALKDNDGLKAPDLLDGRWEILSVME